MNYLDIFDEDYIARSPATGVQVSMDIAYLRRLYAFNRNTIQTYYQTNNFTVRNTNLLSRFIAHFPTSISADIYDYLETVENRLVYLSKHFKFTSPIDKGIVHPPYFFGNLGEELIFSGYDRFNAIEYSSQWKTSSCLKILIHPRSDDHLLLPNGCDDGNRSGIAGIYIDTDKLAIKYNNFVKQESLKPDDGTRLNKNYFVPKYVLSTCLEDLIDHTLLNKLIDTYYKLPIQQPKLKYPFKLFEPTTQVNRWIDDTLKVLQNKNNMDYLTALRHIQLIFSRDAASLLTLPPLSATRQVKSKLLLTRLKYMNFLIDICGVGGGNMKYLNDWKTLIKRLTSDGLDKELYALSSGYELKKIVDKIASL